VSDTNGDQEFFVGLVDTNSSLSSYVLRADSITSKVFGLTPKELFSERYSIETVTLDSYIKKANISKIDILKVDVEGHEFAVLQGLIETLKSSFEIDYI
jgi:FkbM family methyltransferase